MTAYEIRNLKTEKTVITCIYLTNAVKVLDKLNAKYGEHFMIKKVERK